VDCENGKLHRRAGLRPRRRKRRREEMTGSETVDADPGWPVISVLLIAAGIGVDTVAVFVIVLALTTPDPQTGVSLGLYIGVGSLLMFAAAFAMRKLQEIERHLRPKA
jgi:hypothetical protein